MIILMCIYIYKHIHILTYVTVDFATKTTEATAQIGKSRQRTRSLPRYRCYMPSAPRRFGDGDLAAPQLSRCYCK